MRPIERILAICIVLLLLGGLLAEGYAGHGTARYVFYSGCAVAGAMGLLFGWKRASSSLGVLLLLFFAIPLITGGLLSLRLPSSFVTSISPAWAEWFAAREAVGLNAPARVPLALDPEWSARALNQWLAAGAFFAACLIVSRRRAGAGILLAVVVGIGIVEGWLSFFALLNGDDRAHGTLFNPNHSAALILMTLPVAAALIFRRLFGEEQASGTRDFWLFVAGAAALAGLGWIATLSRGSLLCAVIIGGAWIVWEISLLLREASPEFRRKIIGIGAVALLLIVVGGAFARLPAAWSARMDVEGAGYGRLDMWKATWRGLEQSNFVGIGLGGGAVALERHLLNAATRKTPGWSHNDLLQFIAETGALGVLLFLLWGTGLIRELRRLPICRPQWWHLRRNLLDRAILTGMATVVFHSIVDFPLRIPLVGCCYLTLLAIMAGRLTRPETSRPFAPMRDTAAGGDKE